MAALVKAIERKRFKQAKLLLKLGDNVNQQEQLSGKTPLLALCFVEDENLACRMTKKLLLRGADVCMQDEHGMSPLMQACKLGKEKLVKLLLQSEECDFAAADKMGNTALLYSVDAGNAGITKALTEAMNSYDVRAADKPNNKGETPLIRATKLKRDACKEVLLNDGKASPSARDFDLKLNAKEWEWHLKDEKEEIDKTNLRNRVFWGQNRGRCVKSRSSSIIDYRRDVTSSTKLGNYSVSFNHNCNGMNSNKKFLRRTKSAPLVSCENADKRTSTSKIFHFELSDAAERITKQKFPEKTNNSCFEKKTNKGKMNSKQNSWSVGTTGGSFNHHDLRTCSVEEMLPSSAAVTEKQKMAYEKNGKNNENRLPSGQSQLPQLFNLMTHQKTHSFRSSATTPAPGQQRSKWSTREGKGNKRRIFSRRNSTAMKKQCLSGRRWSTVESSLIALGRFSSLYSRSDFQALNPDNRTMLEKSAIKLRPSSEQSNLEELVINGKSSNRKSKSSAISPNLLKLKVPLSASLPDSSGSRGRIKSSRPRYKKHNSDPLPADRTFLSGSLREVAAGPVIEELEEGGDSEKLEK
ncbi:POTE ankyrin domain family member C-like [Stylophora pistillata]|uniref:POTE ankyrin domain family member C-like n=1 Tax=Stylophora pistillata TaxID=50429 RepID=UPI000C040F42|nr:POTE ankyrin domain family member C-like [Stylophora pistillata]